MRGDMKQVRNCWTPVSTGNQKIDFSAILGVFIIGATAFALVCLAAVLGG